MTARRQGDRPRPSWQTWVPLGLVVVSLLALAVLPDTVARRVARLQQEASQRVTPVRNELHAFGLAFAREVLAFRAWALTGDAGFADEYRRSAEDADENQRRVEGVFDELAAAKPDNVSYIVLRLADDSFVHVSFHDHGDDEVNPIASTPAFAHFQDGHADRREGGVDQQTAELVGAYITTID